MELESNNHSVFLMHYHLVLVVKYRRRVITDAVSDRAREIFERIAPTYGITLEEWNHDVDHVHMLFRAQPKTELSKFICASKSASSRLLKKDFHHKAANGLVERYDCVCVEDLDMRGMSRSLKLGKSTMDNGFGMFRALLGYKLEDRGKRLVTVGRLFPSSQLCHECGYRFSGTKDLSVREWTCPLCGRTHDRDVNAAWNIRDEGMRLALSA